MVDGVDGSSARLAVLIERAALGQAVLFAHPLVAEVLHVSLVQLHLQHPRHPRSHPA